MFVLQNIEEIPAWPLIVFANPKSGGNRGTVLIRYFKRMINPVQVFDITAGGPEKGFALHDKIFVEGSHVQLMALFFFSRLKAFSSLTQLRVLVCGGDGTVAWVLSAIDRLGLHTKCSVAILPLGTGNDLARVLGWGPGYDDGNIAEILAKVRGSARKKMDR